MATAKILNVDMVVVFDEGNRESAYIQSGVRGENDIYNSAVDAIESIVLAHHCSGIDISSEAYSNGVSLALESCANNLD